MGEFPTDDVTVAIGKCTDSARALEGTTETYANDQAAADTAAATAADAKGQEDEARRVHVQNVQDLYAAIAAATGIQPGQTAAPKKPTPPAKPARHNPNI